MSVCAVSPEGKLLLSSFWPSTDSTSFRYVSSLVRSVEKKAKPQQKMSRITSAAPVTRRRGETDDPVADAFPEAVGGVGDVLVLVPAHLVGREDGAVERGDDQRRDPATAEHAQEPVDQDEREKHQDQQRGADHPRQGAETGAFDDARLPAGGEFVGAGGGLGRVGDEGPEGAAAEDRQQRRQQRQHRERGAGDPDRRDRAEAGGSVDLGQRQAEQRRDHRRSRGEDRRAGGEQGGAHRLRACRSCECSSSR